MRCVDWCRYACSVEDSVVSGRANDGAATQDGSGPG